MIMKKSLLYLLALPVLMLLLASCHSEEDDFIDRPDPKSLIIKGVARTSGGQPLPNIEVKLILEKHLWLLLRYAIRQRLQQIKMAAILCSSI